MNRLLLISALLVSLIACGQPTLLDSSAPASPLVPSRYHGFTNALALANDRLRAVVVPEIGRIMELSLIDDTSPLRTDGALLDKGPAEKSSVWLNYGGSWMWPAAQHRWKEHCGQDWPPPSGVDDKVWTASAWRQADGTAFCRLKAEIGAPFHLRIVREISLPPRSVRLTLVQRIERIAESTVPATAWNIVQIGGADEVALPLDEGARPVELGFQPLVPAQIADCTGAVAINVKAATEHKTGSTSPRSWIAARRGQMVILMTAKPGDAGGTYPDNGCRVEMYANSGLGYTEIETLGEERGLKTGEAMTNTVTLEIHKSPQPLAGCAFATWVRQLVGELPFPTVP